MEPHYWLYLGFAGQLLFGLRFLVQWVASERKGESIIPIYFWYLSLVGSMILLAYAIFRRDPVFILGQCTGFIVYMRNLMLIYRKRAERRTSPHHRDTGGAAVSWFEHKG
jgi:lipid-A-disaccharide synthase-like uncharacterized protein